MRGRFGLAIFSVCLIISLPSCAHFRPAAYDEEVPSSSVADASAQRHETDANVRRETTFVQTAFEPGVDESKSGLPPAPENEPQNENDQLAPARQLRREPFDATAPVSAPAPASASYTLSNL